MGQEIRIGATDLVEYLATEKKLSARKNQPLVTFGSQLARNALDSLPPIASIALE